MPTDSPPPPPSQPGCDDSPRRSGSARGTTDFNYQQSVKRAKKSNQAEKIGSQPGPKSGEINDPAKTKSMKRQRQMAPRHLLAHHNNLRKLDLEKLDPSRLDILNDCATLVIKDHCLRKSLDWHHWRLVKVDEAISQKVSGYVYFLTFRANNGVLEQTFEARVWDTVWQRRVNRVRTLSPITSEWEVGILWIPNYPK